MSKIPCCPICGLRVVGGHSEIIDCILALKQDVDIEKGIQTDIAQERDELAEALKTYGVHKETCDLLHLGEGKCTCGLDAALDKAAKNEDAK